MLRFILASSAALAMAAPALAQSAAPAVPVPPPGTEATAEPAAAAPATPAPATQTASVEAIIATDFPAYDTDKSGDISEPEFGKWLLELYAKNAAAKPLDEASKAKLTKDAFAKADADKNKKLAKPELIAFFSSGD